MIAAEMEVTDVIPAVKNELSRGACNQSFYETRFESDSITFDVGSSRGELTSCSRVKEVDACFAEHSK